MNLTKLYEMDDLRRKGLALEQENSARAVSQRLGISINSVNSVRGGRNALITDEQKAECLSSRDLLREGMKLRKQNSMEKMAKRFKKSTCTIARYLRHRDPDVQGECIVVPTWAASRWVSPEYSVDRPYC